MSLGDAVGGLDRVTRQDASIAKTTLYWTPEGKHERGLPKNTWRWAVEKEIFLRWGRPGGYQAHGNRQADVEGARCCPKCHVSAKGHEFEFEMS